MDDHAGLSGPGARSDERAGPLHLDDTDAAHVHRCQRLEVAERGLVLADRTARLQDRRTLRYVDGGPVDRDRHRLGRHTIGIRHREGLGQVIEWTQRLDRRLAVVGTVGPATGCGHHQVTVGTVQGLGIELVLTGISACGVEISTHRQGRGILAEANVKVQVGDKIMHTAAEGNGPVSALDAALRKALEDIYPGICQVRLADYKVRILDSDSGTGASVRVLIDTKNGTKRWSTVGASSNIIEASWHALSDSMEYALLNGARDEAEGE